MNKNTKPLLEQVKLLILATPLALDMTDYFSGTVEVKEGKALKHTCNSTACIAGWTCAIKEKGPLRSYCPVYKGQIIRKIEDRAKHYLGLSSKEAELLFMTDPVTRCRVNSGYDCDVYNQAPVEYAKAAVDMIDEFLETGSIKTAKVNNQVECL